MSATKETQFLTVDEVAANLRLSHSTVYRLIHARILPAVRVGASSGSLRVDSAELGEYLNRRRTNREPA